MPTLDKPRKPVAPAPKWSSFKTVKELLDALWKYMDDNGHFGAVDTEPKYEVRYALRKFEEFEPTSQGRWELYSSLQGVGKVNLQIARAVNRAIKLTKAQGFGAEGLVEVWSKISWIW
jgi:hypothetical protein